MIGTAAGVLTASLLGSVHCASMCGGFVCFYSGSTQPGPGVSDTRAAPGAAGVAGAAGVPVAAGAALTGGRPLLQAHALYNLGRLAAYLLLGAIAGAIGGRVSRLGSLVGVQRGAAIVAGLLMIAWAVTTLAAQRGIKLGTMRAPLSWQRALGSVLLRVRNQSVEVRALMTGLFTTLLPCGWLYVFVAAAGGTGSILSAMAMMAVFWLGTVPALLAVGVGAQTFLLPVRRHLPAFSAVLVLAMGLWSVASHLSGGGQEAAHHAVPALTTTGHMH